MDKPQNTPENPDEMPDWSRPADALEWENRPGTRYELLEEPVVSVLVDLMNRTQARGWRSLVKFWEPTEGRAGGALFLFSRPEPPRAASANVAAAL